MTPVARVRPFRPGDEPAVGEICVRTADSGADATGLLADDDIWPAIFAWPYVRRHPLPSADGTCSFGMRLLSD